MSAIMELSGYHWLVLGMLLLVAEVLGTAGFLLGAAIAALATGIAVLIVPELATGLQLALFAIAALLASYLYLSVFRQNQDTEADELNNRSATLIGHQFELEKAISTAGGRVQIGDTFWQVASDADLPAGTRVKVVSAEPMKLQLASME